MTAWHAVTSLGDSALLLPLIAWIGIWLWAPPARWRDGMHWAIAIALCGGGVVLSKLLFMAWGIGPPGLDYTGFSGHTAMSIVVWPTLAALLAGSHVRRRRWMIALGCLVGAGVAISRLALKVHTPSEVALGAILGVAVVAWMVSRLLRPDPTRPPTGTRRLAVLGAGTLVICLACYGRVFPSQHVLQEIALWLNGHSHVFSRAR